MVEKVIPGHFPDSPVEAGHVEAAPRRVRGKVDGEWLFDSDKALYVWEHPFYPQYYIPAEDVRAELLTGDDETRSGELGGYLTKTISARGEQRSDAARLFTEPRNDSLVDTYRFDWAAIDEWFEEDEQIFVHPRSPFTRVDALRSNSPIRIELNGTVLAEAQGSVMVFETGLGPRYYLDKTAISWAHFKSSDTETECPYKGTTSGYWTAAVGNSEVEDVLWGYDFPTRQLQPITGLVAFYHEKFDVFVNGEKLDR